jgi:hypothetical protein
MKQLTICLVGLLFLTGCAAHARISESAKLELFGSPDCEKIVDITRGENRLVVRAMGDHLSHYDHCYVRGAGLYGTILNSRKQEPILIGGGSEADPDTAIDYSALGAGVVKATDYAWDQKWDEVPFVLETFHIDANGNVRSEKELLLAGEKADQKTVDALVKDAVGEIEDTGSDSIDHFLDTLAHLRNIAVADPDRILNAYQEIWKYVDARNSAAGSEILGDFEGDVRQIKEIIDAEQNGSANTSQPVRQVTKETPVAYRL